MSSSPNDPASRSHASLSPSHSQSHSVTGQDVPLQTLVQHLLASKRSTLSSINSVARAEEIVKSARAALEESVILSAQTGFLRNGIAGQVKILKRVRGGVESVYVEGQRDFKNVIRTLDAANSRLESTMDILRSTMVEAAFRPEGEEARNLLDFVDEQGVESMRDALKESIRETKEAQAEFDSSILSFDDDLQALKEATNNSSSFQSNHDLSAPLANHIHNLESNAQEMALLMDSLIKHFDLCKTAIRHTEGGWAAVAKAASSQPPGTEAVSVSGVMTTENGSTDDEPLSEEDRKAMLDILEKDASQVDDVVLELMEFLDEMEGKHEAVQEHLTSLTTTYRDTTNAYQILEGVGSRLPGYIIASQDFKARWEEAKLQIQEQLSELESMRLFYENYYSAYDSMILEVHRRKQCEEKVRSIMKKAMEQIDKVYDVDMKEREGFRMDSGEYLPVDLFPGINTPAPRWDFVLAEDLDPALASQPGLERGVVEAALRREKDRRRLDR
ncbi:hypothetical protein HYALB_00006406 [Hymenoscyphus albidus]|uniref:Autophagy-related protein 17 n=1 Tax=Hymenoscyphus albidus TaxID=595503 RepID=A0A9N9Q4Q7_9HELO|nr:hypothetical protein HYALB_00006406 [Hymenoscyphus albidus]